MLKLFNFFLIIIISIFFAGLYGIFHDQITYSISNEYYTLFKFDQFQISDWGISSERTKVGIIGFLATWWVGLFLGIVYAFISLFFISRKALKVEIKSIILNIGIALIFGIFGFIYATLFLKAENLDWNIPNETQNVQAFINVGSIHNFGYLGGLVGLIVGAYFQVKGLRKAVT
jgi:hypothetical protein